MGRDRQRLEPEWVAVILAALVYAGDLVLAMPGKKFDATGLPQLAGVSVDELAQFKHIEQPRDWNLPALRGPCSNCSGSRRVWRRGSPQGKEDVVQELQTAIVERVEKLVFRTAEPAERLVFLESQPPVRGRNTEAPRPA